MAVKEKNLSLKCLFFGSFQALIIQQLFRHKREFLLLFFNSFPTSTFFAVRPKYCYVRERMEGNTFVITQYREH